MTDNKITRRPKYIIWFRVLFALLAISVAVFIFIMSAQNAHVSSNSSGTVIKKIVSVIDRSFKEKDIDEQMIVIRSLQKFVRKSAHFCIYGLLGTFVAAFFATFKKKFCIRFAVSQIICSLYAVSDEFHQHFVEGRSCELRDMLIDSCGGFCGIIFVLLIVLLIEKRRGRFRMRKKELIKQNETLTEKILEADKIIEFLKNQLKDKENEISFLKEKLNNITVVPDIVETEENTDENQLQTKNETTGEVIPETVFQPVIAQNYHDFDFVPQQISNSNGDVQEYAVMAIGKIVTESVKINCVLAGSSNENRKELINLVLGRTEVAKEEISSLISADLSADLLKSSIDKESASAIEYFQSILGQL